MNKITVTCLFIAFCRKLNTLSPPGFWQFYGQNLNDSLAV